MLGTVTDNHEPQHWSTISWYPCISCWHFWQHSQWGLDSFHPANLTDALTVAPRESSLSWWTCRMQRIQGASRTCTHTRTSMCTHLGTHYLARHRMSPRRHPHQAPSGILTGCSYFLTCCIRASCSWWNSWHRNWRNSWKKGENPSALQWDLENLDGSSKTIAGGIGRRGHWGFFLFFQSKVTFVPGFFAIIVLNNYSD